MSAGEALALSRAVLAESDVWVVGGAVRDQLLGRAHDDLDLVLVGDVAAAARALARAGRAAAFELSDEFGAWRVVRRDAWQIDASPLHGGSLAADLRLRDFTVNAIAQPLHGGELIDPLGGLADLRAQRLRAASDHAFADDPLRVLRLVRLALALDMAAEPDTLAAALTHAGGLAGVAGERVLAELRTILADDGVMRGLALMDAAGATAALLPELHGLDRWLLGRVVELGRDPAAIVGPQLGAAVASLLSESLADELSRATALRFGALLGHGGGEAPSPHGAELAEARAAREIMTRLRAAERTRAHVAGLVGHCQEPGDLVLAGEPSRRAVFAFLRGAGSVAADCTLLWLAGQQRALTADAALRARAWRLLADALSWREHGPPAALVRGDQLADALGIERGPRLGSLLEDLSAAQYAGEVATREQAIAHAHALLRGHV